MTTRYIDSNRKNTNLKNYIKTNKQTKKKRNRVFRVIGGAAVFEIIMAACIYNVKNNLAFARGMTIPELVLIIPAVVGFAGAAAYSIITYRNIVNHYEPGMKDRHQEKLTETDETIVYSYVAEGKKEETKYIIQFDKIDSIHYDHSIRKIIIYGELERVTSKKKGSEKKEAIKELIIFDHFKPSLLSSLKRTYKIVNV